MTKTRHSCENCGAIYEVGTSFCAYCGTPVPKDEITKTININKNISVDKRYEDVAECKKVDSKERLEMEKLRQKGKEDKRTLLIVISIFLLMFAVIGIFVGIGKYNSNLEEEKLEALAEEIMIDIENGNYDQAFVKANKIHYTAGWSSEIEEKWNEIRESLLKQIEEAKLKSENKTIKIISIVLFVLSLILIAFNVYNLISFIRVI